MVRLYKGVAPGTHHHATDLRTTGIAAHSPNDNVNLQAFVQHVALGSMHSPLISLSSSYAVAAQYAAVGKRRARHGSPGYVYQIDVPDPVPPSIEVHDAALYIANELLNSNNALTILNYRHNGDREFLLSVVNPQRFGHLKSTPPIVPSGLMTSSPPLLTDQLKAMVHALRDAEVMVARNVPKSWVTYRFNVP